MKQIDVNRRCLVVDDVRASREMLSRWFGELAVEVVAEGDGEAAWQRVISERFDLVITDIEMPILCGLELLQRIRRHESQSISRLPVAIITSLMDQQVADLPPRCGATTVMLKPIRKSLLQSVAERILRGEPVAEFHGTDICSPAWIDCRTISPRFRRLMERLERHHG
jgi:CheY-like chemotaxis protein